MEVLSSLLNPKSIAVVGASQRAGRGTNVLVNLKATGFSGPIYAVNPRYQDVLGYPCVPSIDDLPGSVECIVLAVAADPTCDIIEQAFAHGIRAAVVLAGGFGEGGHGEGRRIRLQDLAQKGMSICGPNCYGALNIKSGAAMYSGQLPSLLHRGSVALVSQSGGLGSNVFSPLMKDRGLGFSYIISCGNQIGTTIEDYIEYLVDDPDVTVIAAIVESLKNPRKLGRVARKAYALRKSIVFFQTGKSAAGQLLVQSHTGALVDNSEILAAFLRRCGIVQVDSYDEFIETIELFAAVPFDEKIGQEIIVISGSGGAAAITADAIETAGMRLASLHPATKEALHAALPQFGSVTNPVDGTGSMYDDLTLLPKLVDAILLEPHRPIIAAVINARDEGRHGQVGEASQATTHMRRFAKTFAAAAGASGRTIVAYQPTPLGGPLDSEIIETLHGGNMPLLLGISSAMKALRYLPMRRDYWERSTRMAASDEAAVSPGGRVAEAAAREQWNFLTARRKLVESGIPVIETRVASSEEEAVAIQQRIGMPVAVKAEAPGLLHKSEIAGVRLNCATAKEVKAAWREVVANARKAGFEDATALLQPMAPGVAEVYAGIINDPLLGPAICFGLGGIFIEIFKDATTDMAPLSLDDATQMIRRIRGFPILDGARGRPRADVAALSTLLVRLSEFATKNFDQFRAVDLNPIIVRPDGEGVVVVDIAVEPNQDSKLPERISDEKPGTSL